MRPRGAHSRDDAMRRELAAIEAALRSDAPGPSAEAWRLLRDDVRSLAPAPAPQLQGHVRARLGGLEASGRQTRTAKPVRRRAGRRIRLRPGVALRLTGALAVLVAIAVVVAVAPWHGSSGLRSDVSSAGREFGDLRLSSRESKADAAGASQAAPSSSSSGSAAESAGGNEQAQQGRLQQLGAAIELSSSSSQVQEVADGVSRVTAAEGGFVASSHVQQQSEGASEASLVLSLPSAKLAATLAALGRIAPVRSETQSLQDVTEDYEGAQRSLGEAQAEHAALLRALAAATTSEQIEDLHAGIAEVDAKIRNDASSVHSIAGKASRSQVEVTVVSSNGDAARSTLSRGLHDAGHVLAVAGAVVLVALAVLVPLMLLIALLLASARAWRRLRRESALGSR
jgi:hypothetical protein